MTNLSPNARNVNVTDAANFGNLYMARHLDNSELSSKSSVFAKKDIHETIIEPIRTCEL